jgi:uncharacterized membrane protein YedE/YeeE
MRTLLGGAMVGLGAVMCKGSTSRHGVCSNARLPVHSAVYTLTLMTAGVY